MKKTTSSLKDIEYSKYSLNKDESFKSKSTNINILLNRVKLDQKKESRKKILFSLLASVGVLTFGFLIT